MKIGRGKIKGLYRSCRKEFLRGRGSVDAVYREARRFLRQELHIRDLVLHAEDRWLTLMIEYIRSNRMWGQLSEQEREHIVGTFRDQDLGVELLPLSQDEELLQKFDLVNATRR